MSRPKKIILCVDADLNRLGQMALLLKTYGYHVERAHDAPEALAVIELLKRAMRRVDVLMVEADLLGAENLIAQMKAKQPEVRTMLLAYRHAPEVMQSQADVFLPGILCFPAEILERLKRLAVRRRGPKRVAPRLEAA